MSTERFGDDRALLEAALAAMAAGDLTRASETLAILVEQTPDWAEAHFRYGQVHAGLGAQAQSEAALRTALELDSRHTGAAYALGRALFGSRRSSEALVWLAYAAGLAPDRADIHHALGMVSMYTGDLDQARTSLALAIELDPDRHELLLNLVRITRMDQPSQAVERLWTQIERAISNPQAPPIERAKAAQAHGKALEDIGRHQDAFQSFARGAEWARLAHQYDIGAAEEEMLQIAALFDAGLIQRLSGTGDPSQRPVFIVGMPRSGSTLVETILAAHPKVEGGGELATLPDMLNHSRGAQGEPYPQWTRELNAHDCRMLGGAYLDRSPAGLPGKLRTTDKQLNNFLHLGLIHLILPQARIIHVRRDPRDVALSCFTAGFVEQAHNGYVNDLGQLGRYWRSYDTLMAHWREVLPSDVMLEIPYEALVDDLETWARRLVAHCGLEWSAACLDSHQTRRTVRTASVAQVREPVHSRSVGRWKSHAEALAPAIAAMGPLPEAYDDPT